MTVLAAEPLPPIPVNGVTDGAGNLSIPFTAPAHFYALCYIAVQGLGAPSYTVQLGINQPLTFGAGQQANLGPFLLNPGQKAFLVISGATPATLIAGQVLGIQSPDPTGLVTALPVQSTTVQVTGPVTVSGSVVISSGSVSVTGSVTVSGSVSITSGTVTISGPVSITGTVNVSITGSNQVVLGGGSASIGSISAIGSTVTVAGTINIGNTPAVTISGTPTVNISSGTVSISGTPNINIQSQSVNVNTNQPQTDLGNVGSGVTTGFSLPAGTHALALIVVGSGGYIQVTGSPSGAVYLLTSPIQLGQSPNARQYLFIPVISAHDASVFVNNQSGSAITAVVAILDSESVNVHSNATDPLFVIPPPPTHVYINATLAAGANLGLLPAVTTIFHRLLRLQLSLDAIAGNTVVLEDSNANGYWGSILPGPHSCDLGGIEVPQLALAATIRLKNYAAAGITARGYLQYIPGI